MYVWLIDENFNLDSNKFWFNLYIIFVGKSEGNFEIFEIIIKILRIILYYIFFLSLNLICFFIIYIYKILNNN